LIYLYGIALVLRIGLVVYAWLFVARISRMRLILFGALAFGGTLFELVVLYEGYLVQQWLAAEGAVRFLESGRGMESRMLAIGRSVLHVLGHPVFFLGVTLYSVLSSGVAFGVLREFARHARSSRDMIHQLLRQERSLRRHRAREQAILASLPDSLYYVTYRGRILGSWLQSRFADPHASELVAGKSIQETFPALADKLMGFVEAACLTREPQSFEYSFVTRRGRLAEREARIVSVGRHEAVALIRDISERRDMERELRRRTQEQEELLARREALLRELQHRVKNTLQVVLGLIDVQKLKAESPEAARLLAETEERVRSIARVQESLPESPDANRCRLAESVRASIETAWMASGARNNAVQLEWMLETVEAHIDAALPLALLANLLATELALAARRTPRVASSAQIRENANNESPMDLQTPLEARLYASAPDELCLELRLMNPNLARRMREDASSGGELRTFRTDEGAGLDRDLAEALARQLGGTLRRDADAAGLVCTFRCRLPEERPHGRVRGEAFRD